VSPYDLALICGTACYLATVGAVVGVALAYRKQARLSAPPREEAQVQPDAAEKPLAARPVTT